MATKKFFMVLDTETVTASRKVFDLGFEIIDRQGNVYESGSYVIAEQVSSYDGIQELVWDNFTKDKCPTYLDAIINRHGEDFVVYPFESIREIVNNTLKEYNATLCAYNIAFDLNALNKTSQHYLNCDFFEEMPELLDIWAAAMSTICTAQKYIKFIAENAILTEKGNPQTGAQAIYQFLTNNTYFEEAHTALKDCEIESEIFTACVKTHKKMNREVVGMCLHNPYWQDIIKRYNEYSQN